MPPCPEVHLTPPCWHGEYHCVCILPGNTPRLPLRVRGIPPVLEHADVVVRLPLWVRGIPTTSSLNWPSSKIPPTGTGNTPASLSGSRRRLLPADTENANGQSTLRVWELATPGIKNTAVLRLHPSLWGTALGGHGEYPPCTAASAFRKDTAPKDAGNTLNAADAMLKIGTASGGRGSSLPPEALPFILSRLPSADCPPGGRCP